MNKFYIMVVSFAGLLAREDYFQQHVAYDITLTLDDSAHTISAHEIIQYTNNSPDELDFIWFHLWPNAYKNHETAFAKQKELLLRRKALQRLILIFRLGLHVFRNVKYTI